MTHIGTALLLLGPAALAAGLHARLMPAKRATIRIVGIALLYAFAIAYLLSCAKLLRGKGAIPLGESFDTVRNFAVYGPVALLLAVILPMIVRRARTFLSGIRGEERADEPAPLEPKAPAKRVESDAALAGRAEASLAAQEEEITSARAKVVPARRASDGPVRTLYNVSARDGKAAKKTVRQRIFWALIYALLVLCAFAIVYGVLTSPVGL